MWRKPSYICLITRHNSRMMMSRLRGTAIGGLVLTVVAWCYTRISGNVICHHAPHETCEFPCNCRFSYIVFLTFIKHHLVVSTSKTFVSFVSISDNCRRIPWLTGFQFFGFETNLSSCIALWRLYWNLRRWQPSWLYRHPLSHLSGVWEPPYRLIRAIHSGNSEPLSRLYYINSFIL